MSHVLPLLACRQIAEGILKSSGISGYQLGTSKVFLRAGQMAMLDKQRTEKLTKAATVMQRHARGWLARLHYKQDLLAVVRMQVSADTQHVEQNGVQECLSALACGAMTHLTRVHDLKVACVTSTRGTLCCLCRLSSKVHKH
jgi:myosin heavy subunit